MNNPPSRSILSRRHRSRDYLEVPRPRGNFTYLTSCLESLHINLNLSSAHPCRAKQRNQTRRNEKMLTRRLPRMVAARPSSAFSSLSSPSSRVHIQSLRRAASTHSAAPAHDDHSSAAAHGAHGDGHGHGAGGHDDHFDPPSGWLWGQRPGEKYEKEGWEGLAWVFTASWVIAIAAYTLKEDTSYVFSSPPLDFMQCGFWCVWISHYIEWAFVCLDNTPSELLLAVSGHQHRADSLRVFQSKSPTTIKCGIRWLICFVLTGYKHGP